MWPSINSMDFIALSKFTSSAHIVWRLPDNLEMQDKSLFGKFPFRRVVITVRFSHRRDVLSDRYHRDALIRQMLLLETFRDVLLLLQGKVFLFERNVLIRKKCSYSRDCSELLERNIPIRETFLSRKVFLLERLSFQDILI